MAYGCFLPRSTLFLPSVIGGNRSPTLAGNLLKIQDKRTLAWGAHPWIVFGLSNFWLLDPNLGWNWEGLLVAANIRGVFLASIA